jgi:sugar-specific transcriptional regulator TrmB
MRNEKLLTILKNIGLTETEATVYLTALSLGSTTILKIARGSGVKRTSVYDVVSALSERGLMKTELKGLKKLYSAENPEKLATLLETRQEEFAKELPTFLALYKLQGSESVMKYYTGLRAMQQIYMETLKEIRPREDYLVIANQEKWHNLDPKFAVHFSETRAKLPIKTRLLLQDSPTARSYKKIERNYNQEVKLLPAGTPLNVDTLLLPKKLITFELTPPYMTVVIENKSIIALHQEMFEVIWKSIR